MSPRRLWGAVPEHHVGWPSISHRDPQLTAARTNLEPLRAGLPALSLCAITESITNVTTLGGGKDVSHLLVDEMRCKSTLASGRQYCLSPAAHPLGFWRSHWAGDKPHWEQSQTSDLKSYHRKQPKDLKFQPACQLH